MICRVGNIFILETAERWFLQLSSKADVHLCPFLSCRHSPPYSCYRSSLKSSLQPPALCGTGRKVLRQDPPDCSGAQPSSSQGLCVRPGLVPLGRGGSCEANACLGSPQVLPCGTAASVRFPLPFVPFVPLSLLDCCLTPASWLSSFLQIASDLKSWIPLVCSSSAPTTDLTGTCSCLLKLLDLEPNPVPDPLGLTGSVFQCRSSTARLF